MFKKLWSYEPSASRAMEAWTSVIQAIHAREALRVWWIPNTNIT